LVALIVTVVTPAVVGVPEINPVVVFTPKPAGNGVALKLVGLLVAVIWYVNATPTVPVAVKGGLMTGIGGAAKTLVADANTRSSGKMPFNERNSCE